MNTPKSTDEKAEASDKEMRSQLWALLAALLIALIIAILAYGFFWSRADAACYLASNRIYMWIWPPNLRDAEVLLRAGYATTDSCILLSTRSIISAVMLIYILYLFVSQAWIRDTTYVPRIIPISVFIIAGYLYVSTRAISTEPADIYSLSTHSGVAVNLIKSYVKISGLYLGIALFSQRIFALLRFKYNMSWGLK